MYGDAVLDITPGGDLHLKVYTLVFSHGPLLQRCVVKSSPRLDRPRRPSDAGSEDCLFWWTPETMHSTKMGITLSCRFYAFVWLDRKTLLQEKRIDLRTQAVRCNMMLLRQIPGISRGSDRAHPFVTLQIREIG